MNAARALASGDVPEDVGGTGVVHALALSPHVCSC